MAAVIVNNLTEFATALSNDNDIDYVYLGVDIVMTSGIIIHRNKTNLVIDGLLPDDETGTIHSLTDPASAAPDYTINIRDNPLLEITFKNLTIFGRNYYGIPCVYDYILSENVTVIYMNVTYNGPQMIWNTRGLTRLIDCNIEIPLTAPLRHEVGEVCKLEIGGNTTINHATTGYSVFNIYRNNAYVKILKNANVQVTTAYDFFFCPNLTPVTIEENAVFVLTASRGFSRGSGHRVSDFIVESNAVFKCSQTANVGDRAMLYVSNSFTVNKGSYVYMDSQFIENSQIIALVGSAVLNLNNPKSFVLYKSGIGTNSKVFLFEGTKNFNLSGSQLNYWRIARPFPEAGTFDDPPLYSWHNDAWTDFLILGTSTNTSTSLTSYPSDIGDLSGLRMYEARVIALGDLPLDINPVTNELRPITGTTDPFSNIMVSYSIESIERNFTGISEGDGGFTIHTGEIIPLDTIITVASNNFFLTTIKKETVMDMGSLVLLSAPAYAICGGRRIPGLVKPTLARREITPGVPEEPVVISDSRIYKTPWELMARIARPLQTINGEIMDNAVVFAATDCDPDSESIVLKVDDYSVILKSDPLEEERIPLVWPLNRGIIIQLSGVIHSGKQYITDVEWEVRPAEDNP